MDFDTTPMMNECGFFPGRVDRRWCLGLDIGQVNDPSAISIVERVVTPIAPENDGIDPMTLCQRVSAPVYNVRHLERLKLGISYPDQVRYVASLLAREPLRSVPTQFALDKTGVGRAVYDLFSAARLKPIGVTITSGRDDKRDGWGGYHVGKVNLIGRLQTAFHTGCLKISPQLKEGPVLVKELQSFAASVAENSGNLSYSARSGATDDLLLSLAIAVWVSHGMSGGSWSVQRFL